MFTVIVLMTKIIINMIEGETIVTIITVTITMIILMAALVVLLLQVLLL